MQGLDMTDVVLEVAVSGMAGVQEGKTGHAGIALFVGEHTDVRSGELHLARGRI